ncbi:threonine/serine dehydratase [Phaeovulum sp.]|uniref:threonine ammonia-lyase n=1 Tax=Phaeovulum sp. TaxID=2934796 RepID=UPI003568A45B
MNRSDVLAAQGRIGAHVRKTPLLSSAALDALAGRRVWLKAECLQHTGSFKARGGWSALSALAPEARARGVIAYSSGNHAQGVARAAAAFGASAVIVMPADAPAVKIANTRALGAEVVLYDRATDDRDAIGARMAEARGLTLVKPFDDPMVIAGQGTIGLELLDDLPEGWQGEILVPCGGGGMSAGIALALEGSGARVRTVEPMGFDDTARSLAAGRIERNARLSGSVCDAIVTPAPGVLTFPILHRLCGPGLAVSDEQAMEAMVLAFRHLRVVLEPGGAVALAAALFLPEIAADVVAIGSGGNVDEALFAAALAKYPG